MSSSPAVLLRSENLGRCVSGSWLIRGRSLTIQGGQRTALIGPSGSGKTLWLRSLAMLDPIAEGNVWWQGETLTPVTIPAYRAAVVYLHQRAFLADGTVETNLRFPYEFRVHRHRLFDRQAAASWLQRLGRNEALLSRPAQHTSGGESQITALVRVLQLDPQILLLDEPTSAVDGDTARLIESCLIDWVDERPQQRAFVWIAHDPALVQRVANRIIEIMPGDGVRESLP